MSASVKGWKRRRRNVSPVQRAKNQAAAKRRRLLSAPITPYQIELFTKHLVGVPTVRGGECWLYGGISNDEYLEPIDTVKYPTMTHNGVHGVRAYRFACAASQGMSLTDLEGCDVHHESPTGDCFGYACCNPAHLHKKPSPETREHRGTRGAADSLIRYQMHIVHSAVSLPYRDMHPDTGPDHNLRELGGVPFRIRGGVLTERADTVNRVGVCTVFEGGQPIGSQQFVEMIQSDTF